MNVIHRRWIVFTFGALLNAALIAVLLSWKPSPNEPVVFFIIAGLWGVADAIWQTQINGTYSRVFCQNDYLD